jgi:4-amino-4-deoxy-L-arabinose transferase-like glycosyltransferase
VLLPLLTPIAIVALVFAAVGPTLGWLEFCNGMENAVAATALGIERGGPRWVPNLDGAPRIQKPPLPAWITTVALRRSTVDALDDADAMRPGGAYARLATQIRSTALLAGCLLLLFVYGLGRAVGDHRLGVLSACVCGSSVFFLHETRIATSDIHLALWVTAANFFFAVAWVKDRRWLGCLGAGAALGLAFMSKGPVAFAQSLVPAALFVIFQPSSQVERSSDARQRLVGPLLVGLVVMLLIAIPWYAYVAAHVPRIAAIWQEELNAIDQAGGYWDSWYTAFLIVPLMFPWFIYFVVGLIGGWQEFRRRPESGDGASRSRSPIALVFLQVVVPLLIMSLFRNRKERYLLPMVAPAAVLTAWALLRCLTHRDAGARVLAAAHWIVLAVAAVALPIAGAFSHWPWLLTGDHAPWYSPTPALAFAASVAALVAGGFLAQRRWPLAAMPAVTFFVMLALQVLFFAGYRYSADAASEMKPLVQMIRTALPPGASVYSYRPGVEGRHAPHDLYIYLNHRAARVYLPADIPPDHQPQALLICQRKGQSLAQLIPATQPAPADSNGWTRVDSLPEEPNSWHLFVRLPGANDAARRKAR